MTSKAPKKPKSEGRKRRDAARTQESRARARAFRRSPVHAVIDPICALIASGMPRSSAAAMHGVSGAALAGRVSEDPEIAAKVLAASAKAESVDLAKLDALIEEGLPTAGQTWKMERLYRVNWNLPTLIQAEGRVEVTSVPVTAEAKRALGEQLLALAALEDEVAARRARGRDGE